MAIKKSETSSKYEWMAILSVLIRILSFSSLTILLLFPHLWCYHYLSSECVLYNIIGGKCDIF